MSTAALPEHASNIFCLEFSSDGRLLTVLLQKEQGCGFCGPGFPSTPAWGERAQGPLEGKAGEPGGGPAETPLGRAALVPSRGSCSRLPGEGELGRHTASGGNPSHPRPPQGVQGTSLSLTGTLLGNMYDYAHFADKKTDP